MGRNTFFAIIFFLKYIFYSNFKYKISDIQLSDGKKEKCTFPWYFFSKKSKRTRKFAVFLSVAVRVISLSNTIHKYHHICIILFATTYKLDELENRSLYENVNVKGKWIY